MDNLSIQRMIQENQWYKAEVAKLQKQLEDSKIAPKVVKQDAPKTN